MRAIAGTFYILSTVNSLSVCLWLTTAASFIDTVLMQLDCLQADMHHACLVQGTEARSNAGARPGERGFGEGALLQL